MPHRRLLSTAPGLRPARELGQRGATQSALSGGGGGLGGALSGLDPTALGSQQNMDLAALGAQFSGLEDAAQAQQEAEQEAQLPTGVVPTDFTDEEALHYGKRMEEIVGAVPGIDSTTAYSVALSDVSMDQAIKMAQARHEAKPKSWWQHVTDPLKSVFIDAPEWVWRKTVVDASQEVGELFGIQPDLAQKMSPGQIFTANLHKMIDMGSDVVGLDVPDEALVWNPDGTLKDPEEWHDAYRKHSGAVDFASRLTMDPFMVFGKARKALVLTGKGIGLARAAGGAQRVQRLRVMEGLDPERAAKVSRDIVRGENSLARFLMGDVNVTEFARSAMGRSPVRRFVDDVVNLREDPEALGHLLTRYGNPKRGFGGLTVEQGDFLVSAARQADNPNQARRAVEDGLSTMLTGGWKGLAAEQLDDVTRRWNNIIGIRRDAYRRWNALRAEAFGQSTETAIERGPRVNGFGDVSVPGAPDDVSREAKLALTDLSASRERAGAEEWRKAVEFLRRNPDEATEAVEGALREVDEQAAQIGEVLKPYLGPVSADPVETKKIVEGFEEITGQLGVSNLLGDFPAESILDTRMSWLGGKPLREAPVLRGLNYMPHRSVNVHDPFWHTQVQRFGRRVGFEQDEIGQWVNTIANRVESPQGMAETMTNMTRQGYRRLGITDEAMDRVMRETNRRASEIFARVDGTNHTLPLYSSQQLNVAQLTDHRMLKAAMRGSRGRGFLGETATEQYDRLIGGLDNLNNVFKRIMVSLPKTGLRVLLETQARALAMGYSSLFANPLAAALVFPTAAFSPKFAGRIAKRFTPNDVRRIAIDSGDTGTSKMLYEMGLLSRSDFVSDQVHRFSDMGGRVAEHNYRIAQANYINDIMMNDELVRRVMLSGDERARNWLRSGDPTARAYQNTLRRLTDASAEKLDTHFDTVRRHMRQMGLDDDEVRSIVLGRNPGRIAKVQAKDLRGKEASELVGGSFFGGDRGVLNRILDGLVNRNLASIEQVGRDFTSRQELYREVMERVRLARTQGQAVDEDKIMTLLSGGQVAREGSVAERAMVNSAKRDVFGRMRWMFFDFSEHSRFAEAARYFAPFGNAYQEVVSRWGAIMTERPWVPHLASVLWNESGDIPGLTYTDPNTGEKHFQIPLSGHLLRFAGLEAPDPVTGLPSGKGYTLSGRLEGFNLVTSGLPGVGPIADLPLRLLKNKPTTHEIWETLFPYGQGSGLGGWLESFEPAVVREARALIEGFLGDEESNVDYGRVLTDQTMEHVFATLQKAKRGDASYAELDRIDGDSVVDETNWIFAIRTAARGLFPAAVRERSPLAEHVEFYRKMMEVDPNFANQVYNARFGPEFQALMENRTEIVEAHVPPPTKKARERIIGDPGFRNAVEHLGRPLWDVFKEMWSGDFDGDMIREQLESGDRRRRSIPEVRESALSAVGWDYYFQHSDALQKRMNAMGIGNLNSKAAAPFRQARDQFVENLGDALPEWKRDFASGVRSGRHDPDIARLAVIANMPQLQSLDGVQGLKEYFELRENLARQMRLLGMKSLNSNQALPLKMSFQEGVRKIVARHPHFSRLWGRYLQRDNPAISLAEVVDKSGVLNRQGVLDSMEGLVRS